MNIRDAFDEWIVNLPIIREAKLRKLARWQINDKAIKIQYSLFKIIMLPEDHLKDDLKVELESLLNSISCLYLKDKKLSNEQYYEWLALDISLDIYRGLKLLNRDYPEYDICINFQSAEKYNTILESICIEMSKNDNINMDNFLRMNI
jgi:hypothetical protein